MRTKLSSVLAAMAIIWMSGCGSTGLEGGDTHTTDTVSPDAPDATDTAVDPAADTAIDPAVDTAIDPVVDTAVDTMDDGTTTACEAAGGYCTEYPVIPDTCVTCDSTSETHYRPAHNPAGPMGCTVEGVGGSPWCCLPHEPGTTDCDMAGGECYPYADPEPCPPGWAMIWSSCGGMDGITCCAPASENCT